MASEQTDQGRGAGPRVRRLASDVLTADEIAEIRALMTAAFGDDDEDRFDNTDWEHALGGSHVVVDLDGRIVGHAAVVERELHIAGRSIRTGYVEAVATAPDRQGSGVGTLAMEVIGSIIAAGYELGALGTGSHHFYERLGWRTWRGPSFVRTAAGDQETPDDDGYIMVLLTPTTGPLDPTSTISCDWRPGDVW
ncbi:MAG: GNAT family N-acetyltransferase [Chloroflexi bacterium]|nr:GNAT family N-acetyltransferase [Chloroflexota bacterium]